MPQPQAARRERRALDRLFKTRRFDAGRGGKVIRAVFEQGPNRFSQDAALVHEEHLFDQSCSADDQELQNRDHS